MKLFNGQLVVVVQASKTAGNLTLNVTDAQRHLRAKTIIKVNPTLPPRRGGD